jgi:ssDNA-binding Zn-finger/Zn-ribbon topoisomerase 1
MAKELKPNMGEVQQRSIPCTECGGQLMLRRGRHGLFYGCENYPVCEQTHGAHQESGDPLGTPGDDRTRRARARAHYYFDQLWRSGKMTRRRAYERMRRHMRLDEDAGHIGMFDVAQCKEVERFVKMAADVFGIAVSERYGQ